MYENRLDALSQKVLVLEAQTEALHSKLAAYLGLMSGRCSGAEGVCTVDSGWPSSIAENNERQPQFTPGQEESDESAVGRGTTTSTSASDNDRRPQFMPGHGESDESAVDRGMSQRITSSCAGNKVGPPQFTPGHGESDVPDASAVGRGVKGGTVAKGIDYSKFDLINDSDDEGLAFHDSDHGSEDDDDGLCSICLLNAATSWDEGVPACNTCLKVLRDEG